MTSTVGWLDQSEEQQRRTREVIALFAESGTVDDIGIGVVRDAFSDLLFPGISTVQTRVRYFFFVPWVYQRLEAERVPSDRAEERGRRWELDLIRALRAGGESAGVIGIEAGDTLKQLPSFIYWNGLRLNGIRHFAGTRSDYFRSMNGINAARKRDARTDAGEAMHHVSPRWHSNLPAPPGDLWDVATLALAEQEALYIQERFAAADPQSLLAHFVRSPRVIDDDLSNPWDAVVGEDVGPVLTQRLEMAQYFSETIHGAALLYNLMLAELAAERGLGRGDERLEHFREQLDEWEGLVTARRAAIDATSRSDFWQQVYESGANVTGPARRFVNAWLDLVANGVDVRTSDDARALIRQRERSLKKGLSRLNNPRSLENWGGSAGAARLTYRWGQGRLAVNDVAAGLGMADV